MKEFRYIWVVGLIVTLLIVALPIGLVLSGGDELSDDPWAGVPDRVPPTDHSDLMEGPFETGQDVTNACLECHEDAATQVMETAHWTWVSDPIFVEDRDETILVGKANSLNNFCIGIQSNWPGCTRCHAGYGWEDGSFDFSVEENVDCLACHDQSGLYVKTTAGNPAEGSDLLAAAQSVSTPTRQNCGSCHFNGGGGNGVKHGDLDESLYFPTENLDVHMGGLDFQCVDCHQTEDHHISGRAISVSMDDANQVYCADCHDETLHEDARINDHTDTVACQTCHIPAGARREPTKMDWDWSTAGQDLPEDPHEYLKIKGSFVYETDFVPEYDWYSGGVEYRYLLGDPINPDEFTALNPPAGSIDDPEAKIFPFKVHTAMQPYDAIYEYLLQPKTVGEGGFGPISIGIKLYGLVRKQ